MARAVSGAKLSRIQNGLRHSFASYRLALVKRADQVALEMGNSPRKLFQNYRELVTEQDALDWFEVAPNAPTPAEKREKCVAKKKILPLGARLRDMHQPMPDKEFTQWLEGAYLKRSAALLFGKAPENSFTGAYIKVGFFVTDDNLLYQDVIGGNLFEQVEKTLELIYFKYLKASIRYEGLQRIESYPFPRAALREALLNAVVHKDYSSGVPIQISVYADRLVLWNPGQLPPDWTLARLLGKHPSSPYNPLLANAFFLSGYIESWGRGIEKIAHECAEHGIRPPDYDSGMSGLMLTFHASAAYLTLINPKTTGPGSGGITEKTSGKMSGKIVAAILETPEITIPEMAERLQRTERTIERLINRLKADEVIKRIGPAKGGHWEILK